MSESRRKLRWRYWTARGVALAAVVLFVGACVGASRSRNPALWFFAWIVVFFIPGLLAATDLLVFPFRYGTFGQYERTPFPDEKPACSGSGAFAVIPFWCPLFSGVRVHVFPSGFGVSILFVGRAFVRFSKIDAVRWHPRGGCTIKHSSPELTSPILLRDRKTVAALRAALDQTGRRDG